MKRFNLVMCVQIIATVSLLLLMSGCAGGELYVGMRGYNRNSHNESYVGSPEDAKAVLREKY